MVEEGLSLGENAELLFWRYLLEPATATLDIDEIPWDKIVEKAYLDLNLLPLYYWLAGHYYHYDVVIKRLLDSLPQRFGDLRGSQRSDLYHAIGEKAVSFLNVKYQPAIFTKNR